MIIIFFFLIYAKYNYNMSRKIINIHSKFAKRIYHTPKEINKYGKLKTLAKYPVLAEDAHMLKTSLLLIAFALCLLPVPLRAEEAATDSPAAFPLRPDIRNEITSPTPIVITKAVDATTVLDKEGALYAPTGLDIPDDSHTAPQTLKRLAELTEGKKCTLTQTRNPSLGRIDRMNHILGHLTCGPENIWIQGALIREGLARVRTTPENPYHASLMLILESQARSEKRGLWGLSQNAPLTPETAPAHINGFAIVEARVYAVAQTRDAIFLNFASDWKHDFTIGIPTKLRKDFSKRRIDLFSLKGKTVRVRGWLRSYNGPYIELDHVDPLEILADPSPSSPPPEK